MSERQLTDAVVELAQRLGWRVVHFRPARTATGWRTAGQGNVAGWPDIFAVRGSEAIAIELKSGAGRLTNEQEAWLRAMSFAGITAYVRRPADWTDGTIEAELRGKGGP